MTRRLNARTLGCAAALLLASCFGDSTAPKAARRGHFAFAPVFAKTGLAAADFDHVHVLLTPVGGDVVALYTVVAFPLSAPSLTLQFQLQITGSSEDFDLTVALFNAAGDTTYRGGPVRLTATAALPTSATNIPLVYVGPGAVAASVRFTASVPGAAYFGDTVTFTAQALDSSGTPIAGTPIGYMVDVRDTIYARIPDASVGRVIAKSLRGQARVIAALLTGQADTTPLVVQPKPTAVAVATGNTQTGPAGSPLAQPVTFRVTAADNQADVGVPVSFAIASGGGSLGASTGTTDANGLVAVTWTLGATAGPQSMTATVAGLTPATATATATVALGTIALSVPGGLVGIGASQQAQAVVTLTPPAPAGGVTVTVTSDSTKYVTVQGSGTINIAAGATVGTVLLAGVAPGATILHATAPGYTAGLSAAVATPNFISLTYDTVGIGRTATLGITLSTAAPAGGLAVSVFTTDSSKVRFIKGAVTNPPVGSLVDTIPAGSTSLNVTMTGLGTGTVPVVAVAATYAIGIEVAVVVGFNGSLALVSGGGQTGGTGTLLAQAITVRVTDSVSNPVSGFLVNFAVPGGGSVSPVTATTDATGQASTSWTLGATAGTQSLVVTALGATGSPLTVTATALGPGVASTTVTPKRDTVTAINGTFQLTAQAKDGNGSNVVGAFTWTSRKPSAVTVSTTGLVTGLVNNDSSWVVATESGGTKDSAIIVVEQKLASITVSPQVRSLYLGTTFSYTATAVDGLGTPLPGNPTFTWSTTAPAVATVDASGLVSAIGLGSAQIKATSGTVTGVGNLSVITAITRIAVAVDSTGATKTDTATLTALTATRRYHAIAYDTLNALMPAVTQFTWVSSNPSVAGIPNQTSDTATATSAANGVTTIKATAQGFVSAPGALLTVSQKLKSIQLSPATATIGVTGQVALLARGLDSLGKYISGGAFSYLSSNTNLATVGATTGVVTGVSVGTDTVTADSGSIVSNPSVIVVSNSVPKAISFGRDTVSVGRGSQASIPILLSTPVPVGGPALIVKLGVSPAAWAHWSTPTVSIPQGASSVNATLVGDSAGTTTVTASDSTGLGYAVGSAVAKVTANMSLSPSSFGVNTTDIATAQVLLSDPSPAGGTYITWLFGTPGVAAISPDPAFIPPGQLAADIQIRALGAGSTTITPQATGVNGAAASFTAYAPVLQVSTGQNLLGLGQYQPNDYVYLPSSTNLPLPVTLTSSDTTKGTVTPVVTVPSNSNYAYFTVTAQGLGTATITPAATGWTAGSAITLITTTPHLGLSGGGTIYTTSGIQYLTAYAEDSAFGSHYRTNSLVINLRSSDPTVMQVIDSVVTINPGTYYSGSIRVTPGALGGAAWIVVSASGHMPDSVQYTVNGPPLNFSWSTRYIGVGEQDPSAVYVYVPNSVTSPLVIRLKVTDSTKVGVPDSVIIPINSNYVYFPVQGLAPGSVTFTATALGYQTATGPTYTVTSPALVLNTTAYTFNNFNGGSNFYVYAADTTRGTHYRITPDTIAITVRNPAVATVDSSTVTIAAGAYYNGNAHVTPVAPGTTYIVISANGQKVLDSLLVTVNTPLIQFNFGSTLLGRRQHMNPNGNGFYVYTPDSRTVTVPATLTQKQATVDSLSTLAPTIPASTNYVYVDAFGLAYGTDTLSVAASGYNSGSPAYITVTTPRLTANNLPGSTTTTNLSAINVNVFATDSIGNSHYTMDTVTVHAVSSDSTVIKPDSAYFHLLKNGYYVTTFVHVYGPGTAYMVFSDSANSGYKPDTTNTMTVTGPSLLFNTSSTMLGMRQTTGASGIYVYTQNNPTSPQVVRLKSTDTLVVTVPDSVVIPTTANYVYFPVNAMDTLGTIQVQATATGFGSAAMSVQVTRPVFAIGTSSVLNTTSGRSNIYVYAQDANGTNHYTTDSVVVTLISSAPSVANIDSTTVTIPKGQPYNYPNNLATWGPNPTPTPGTAQIIASDGRAALYAYQTGTYNVTVQTPNLNFNWGTQTLGLGQYNNDYVYSPDNAAAPIVVTLAHSGTARTSTTVGGTAVSTVTIPAATNITYFHVVGTAVGWDTLGASATSPPFNPTIGYTAVSQGHVDPLGGWPSTLSLSTNDSVLVYLYARDSTQATHYVQDSTTFTLAGDSHIQFWSGGANSVQITSIVIPKDAYYVQLYVKAVAQGTGQATISATNYVTYQTPAITVSP